MKPKPINQQTNETPEVGTYGTEAAFIRLGGIVIAGAYHGDESDMLPPADAALLAASYGMLNHTARELGVDAVELAESLDLFALVRVLESIHDDADHALGTDAPKADKPGVMQADLRAIRARCAGILSKLPTKR